MQVNLIDGKIVGERKLWQEINNLTADIVFISATIRQVKGAEMVAEVVKENNPATAVILGGSGPSALGAQIPQL